ncbi:MAG TPA: AsmA-like C-terminal region-containing protein, partial [Candidatus Udaeobacter sp.]|nr:AsmA-like C-terminal region-containing protein [Candidatus Udaeobacter sp.]
GATLADLSVAPTRIKIEELQQLATWMGIGLPGAMRSPDPVAVALRAQGNLTDKSQLRLTGSLQATRLAWEAPFLHQPLEDVAATVRFAGDGFETKGFTAKLGGTTWRGDLAVQDLGAPKVQFALATPQADLGQLMSAFGSGGPGGTGNAPTGSQRVNNVTGGGTIAIASGTFNTLVFSDLQARVELAGGTIRLAPLDFGLYGGKYAGQSTVDLRGQVPIIQHDCALVGVDANGLLSTNPKLKDVLHGTLAARFDGAGSGQTMESLLGSLTGSGDFKIVNGTLTRSSMLKGLSDVAGLFGERTLTQLSARMTTNETPFSALSGAFRVAGGQLTTDNLLLTTSDFSLAAKGRVAIDKRLGFQGRIVFSDAISRTLREEGSRAVYLGEDNGRVAIPVAVSGTLDRPAFEVDFGAAAGYAVSKTITDRIAEALERRQAPKPPPAEPPAVKAPANPLKVQQPPVATPPASKSPAPATPPASKSPAPATPPASKPPTPAPSKSPTDTTASAGKAPPPAPEKESPPPSPEKNPEPDQKAEKSEPAPADLRVRVESHALAGDRAQPDLAVKGSVSGSHLAGLLVVVTDDGGRVVHQEKRLVKEIAAAYGTRSRNEAVTVPFAFQIAGARLPAKAKSVKMTLTAVADNGQRSPPASIAQPMPRGT